MVNARPNFDFGFATFTEKSGITNTPMIAPWLCLARLIAWSKALDEEFEPSSATIIFFISVKL